MMGMFWRQARLTGAVAVFVLVAVCTSVLCGGAAKAAGVGVTDTEVTIGSCISLSGGLAARGHGITQGANTYFSYINDQGGVNGRKIKLVTSDDCYDPDKAIECFNAHLKDKVFAGAFFVGSAPVTKYVRMADTAKLPLMGFCTGTPVIYEFHASQFVLRPGYADEVQKAVEELHKRGIKKVAILYQDDAFGAAIRENVVRTLQAHQLTPVVQASYTRNTAAVENAIKTVKTAKPEAVVLGASSDALMSIIKEKNNQAWNALLVTLSVTDEYIAKMGKAADGIVVTQVVPPLDSHLAGVALYNKLRSKYYPASKPQVDSLEAFLNAMVLVEGLKRAGPELTREKFVAALESIHDLDLGVGPNFKVSFSPASHRGLSPRSIYFTVVKDGSFANMTDADWDRLVRQAKTQ
jgi:branched-chain amino acid transport system substrate-binding protein